MKDHLNYAIIAILLMLNIFLLLQNRNLRNQIATTPEAVSDSIDIVQGDLYGVYAYPGFGAWFAPIESDGHRHRSPLTLNVFLSSATECPAIMSELPIFRTLNSTLKERGQRIVAVCAGDESTGVASLLREVGLDVPLVSLSIEDSSMTFADLGISRFSMPFKVIYDSTFSAIYVRGADNTPESQADFEKAVLRLSSLVHRGEL